jgi:hypothetical protein
MHNQNTIKQITKQHTILESTETASETHNMQATAAPSADTSTRKGKTKHAHLPLFLHHLTT